LACGPEVDQGFQAGEQAGQGGEDEGLQRRNHPGFGRAQVGFRTDSGRDGGDLRCEGGWGCC
jgi:hypothetical protein